MQNAHCPTCGRVYLAAHGPIRGKCVCGEDLTEGLRAIPPPGYPGRIEGGWLPRDVWVTALLVPSPHPKKVRYGFHLQGPTKSLTESRVYLSRDSMIALVHDIETMVKS